MEKTQKISTTQLSALDSSLNMDLDDLDEESKDDFRDSFKV